MTPSLIDWLRGQLDDDHRVATEARWRAFGASAYRRIAALRAIVDRHEAEHECPGRFSTYSVTPDDPCPTLRDVGSMFNDRAGYRPEWSIEQSEECGFET